MKPLISICMIVKNEEKNLRRCLESISGLLERDDVELNIVDTGSTDRTPDIAREYTDRLFSKEWNNSFSDMRNHSISQATGRWIMILDADETLESPAEEIIELLTGPESGSFHTVRIIELNILSSDEAYTSSFVQERFFRNDGSFQYRGTVHNQPVYKHPVHQSKIGLKHYGYINDDAELMQRKFDRTATLLKRELEKDPSNYYYRYQLGKTYSMAQRFYEAIVEVQTAYQLAIGNETIPADKKFFIYGELVKLHVHLKNNETAIRLAREGLTMKSDYLDLHFFLGMAFLAEKRWHEAADAYSNYLEGYRKFFSIEAETTETQIIDFHSLSDRYHVSAMLSCIQAMVHEGRHAEALVVACELPEGPNRHRILCELHDTLGSHEQLRIEHDAMTDSHNRIAFVGAVEEYAAIHPDRRSMLDQAFSRSDSHYGKFCAIRLLENPSSSYFDFLLNLPSEDLLVYPYVEAVESLLHAPARLFSVFNRLNAGKLALFLKVMIERHSDRARAGLMKLLSLPYPSHDPATRRTRLSVSRLLLAHAIHSKRNGLGAETESTVYRLFVIFLEMAQEDLQFRFNLDHAEMLLEDAGTETAFLLHLHLMERSFSCGLVRPGRMHGEAAAKLVPEYSEPLACMLRMKTPFKPG